MNILMLGGSLGSPSRTKTLMHVVRVLLENKGIDVILWDLGERLLPPANPNFYTILDNHPDSDVRALQEIAKGADGFVWASPVYHNSYSGILKNALDFLDMTYFWNKPVGLIAAGGSQRSPQPCDHLRIVARGLHALAIPSQLIAANSDFENVDGQYKLTSKNLLLRANEFVEELVNFLLKS